MALADDLQEREQQAGNTSDNLDPAQQHYDEQFDKIAKAEEDRDFDDIIADNYGPGAEDEKVDAHGDTIRRNYNADDPEDSREDLENREQNPDSLYKSGADATSGLRGDIVSWLSRNGKKYGASGGVLGILGVGMIVISIFLSPAALFATIEKSLTNDGSDFSRTNSAMYRAFRGGLFSGECTGSKLKCKFVTMTKNQLQKWTDNRFKITGTVVDADGKQVSGGEREIKPDDLKDGERVKPTAAEFPNGTKVTTNAQFEAETDRHIESRRWSLRVIQDKTGPFFTAKFNKVLSKFGLSKGSIAKKDSKPPEDENKKRTQVESEKEKAKSKVTAGLDRFTKGAGLVTGPVSVGCTVYNTLRIVVGAVKAKWIADVVAFAFPFVQYAAKLADGSVTDADFEDLEGRANQLVWYPNAQYTKELADKESDPEKKKKIEEKQDLTATDSQGLRMAMYGDTTALKDFTEDYTTGGLGSVAALSAGIKEFQDAFPGGRQGIREACITAQRGDLAGGAAQIVLCAISGTLTLGLALTVCALKTAATVAAFYVATQVLIDQGTELLIKALATADIPSDLRGVDAGNALAAGIGLMLSRSSLGYGLKPAKSADEVRQFISMTNDSYNEDVTEIAKAEARDNPFDLYNEYSFASTMNQSLNQYIDTGRKTGFAVVTNMLSVISNTLVPSARALHSQPSLMTNTEDNLNHRLNVTNGQAKCPDTDKEDIGVVCDWSGRIVGVTSSTVLQWASQMANGDPKPLYDTIDYMQQQGNFKDVGEKSEPDGGTYDETCANYDNIVSGVIGGGCDDSKERSINDDGSTVENSQYSKYKKYCTEDRAMDIGSADETIESGTAKDQDWVSGKQCAKDSEMMDRFAFYFNMCEGMYSMANDEETCYNAGSSQPTSANGDACSLLNNPNIIYVIEGTKQGLKEICETGRSVNSCGNTNYTLDQELMNILTTLSSKYKVWLNNFGFKYDRFSCDTGQHPKGKAVDLNGIEKLDGSGRAGGPDWGGITYSDPRQVKVINDYASDWLAGINHSHGGVGQKGCSSSFNPRFPSDATNVNGAAFFADSCDHLHIDVRDRGGPSAL